MAPAGRYTDLAGLMLQKETGLGIDKIGGRHGLREINVNRSGKSHTLVEFVNQMPGAIGSTDPAGGTFVRVNITRPQPDIGGKITGDTIKGKKISVAKNLYVWRPTGLN